MAADGSTEPRPLAENSSPTAGLAQPGLMDTMMTRYVRAARQRKGPKTPSG